MDVTGKKLILFDVDGTVVKKFSLDLLPGVEYWFREWQLMELPRPEIALVSNQGGVGLRHYLEQEGIDDFARYPTKRAAEERLYTLARQLGMRRLNVYMAFAYQFRSGGWAPTPIDQVGDIRWSRNWRKPNPGMLQQALADLEVTPAEAVMVGDWESDEQAAIAAGIPFMWAAEFFPARYMPLPMQEETHV